MSKSKPKEAEISYPWYSVSDTSSCSLEGKAILGNLNAIFFKMQKLDQKLDAIQIELNNVKAELNTFQAKGALDDKLPNRPGKAPVHSFFEIPIQYQTQLIQLLIREVISEGKLLYEKAHAGAKSDSDAFFFKARGEYTKDDPIYTWLKGIHRDEIGSEVRWYLALMKLYVDDYKLKDGHTAVKRSEKGREKGKEAAANMKPTPNQTHRTAKMDKASHLDLVSDFAEVTVMNSKTRSSTKIPTSVVYPHTVKVPAKVSTTGTSRVIYELDDDDDDDDDDDNTCSTSLKKSGRSVSAPSASKKRPSFGISDESRNSTLPEQSQRKRQRNIVHDSESEGSMSNFINDDSV